MGHRHTNTYAQNMVTTVSVQGQKPRVKCLLGFQGLAQTASLLTLVPHQKSQRAKEAQLLSFGAGGGAGPVWEAPPSPRAHPTNTHLASREPASLGAHGQSDSSHSFPSLSLAQSGKVSSIFLPLSPALSSVYSGASWKSSPPGLLLGLGRPGHTALLLRIGSCCSVCS